MIYLKELDVYTNFTVENIPKPVSTKVRGIVVGNCGSGKTSLFNSLTNPTTKYPTGFSQGSLTIDIAYEDVFYDPGHFFRMYDTPGIDSAERTLELAQILRSSLTSKPLNLIMVNSKLENRYSNTLGNLSKLLQIFKGYESMVVCMISHMDLLDSQDLKAQKTEIIEGVVKGVEKYNKSLKVIIYSNRTSIFDQMKNVLYILGEANEERKFEISDKTFFKYFKIAHSAQALSTQDIRDYVEQIRDAADVLIEKVKDLDQNTSNAVQIISEYKQFMKYHLKQLQSKQYKEYSSTFKNDGKKTDLFLAISQEIQTKLEEFEKESQLKYQKTFYNKETKQMTDIRDLVKECPKCKLLWMKTEGQKWVRCGERSYQKDNLDQKDVLKYNFKMENGDISYTTEVQEKASTINSGSSVRYERSNDKASGVGCGHIFNFDAQPRTKRAEEHLKQLFGVSNFEEIKLNLDWLQGEDKQFHQVISDRVTTNKKKLEEDKQ